MYAVRYRQSECQTDVRQHHRLMPPPRHKETDDMCIRNRHNADRSWPHGQKYGHVGLRVSKRDKNYETAGWRV